MMLLLMMRWYIAGWFSVAFFSQHLRDYYSALQYLGPSRRFAPETNRAQRVARSSKDNKQRGAPRGGRGEVSPSSQRHCEKDQPSVVPARDVRKALP